MDFSSRACPGSLMLMAAGWCLRACSSKRSALLPAASPTSRIRSGRSSATLMVLVPMDPVLPSRTTFFMLDDDPAQLRINGRNRPFSIALGQY